ncbi:histone-lysine_N-methyltransferase 2A-like isoform X1 [Hexamita inflata]|uniref:Histone-lysine N-methyltransferase 2A-like isoform X1 n=1 Tax=Hexamita inflata TaxID=28002 RepID=A0AA86R8D7_9EUKA|nr:histone-lysine N-methyltransferase 2A-like isoform X1 [Hexamita inflata]
MDFTMTALDMTLPPDATQQNIILKKMVYTIRNRVQVIQSELTEALAAKEKYALKSAVQTADIDALQNQLTVHEQNYAQITNSLLNLRSTFQSALSENKSLKEQLASTQSQLQMQISSTNSLTHKLNTQPPPPDLNPLINKYEQSLKQQQSEATRIANEANTKINDAHFQLQLQISTTENYKKQVQKLRTENELMQKQFETLYQCSDSQQLIILLKEKKQIQEQVKQLETEIEDLKQEINNVKIIAQRQIKQALEDQQLDLDMKHQAHINSFTTQQLQQLQKITDEFTEQIYQRDQKIIELENTLKGLIQNNKTLAQEKLEIKTKQNEIEKQCTAAIAKAKKRYEMLQLEIETAQLNIKAAEAEKQIALDEKSEAKKQLYVVKEELADSKAAVRGLQSQIELQIKQKEEMKYVLLEKDKQLSHLAQVRFDLQTSLQEKQELGVQLNTQKLEQIKLHDALRMQQSETQHYKSIVDVKQELIDQQNVKIEELGAEMEHKVQEYIAQLIQQQQIIEEQTSQLEKSLSQSQPQIQLQSQPTQNEPEQLTQQNQEPNQNPETQTELQPQDLKTDTEQNQIEFQEPKELKTEDPQFTSIVHAAPEDDLDMDVSQMPEPENELAQIIANRHENEEISEAQQVVRTNSINTGIMNTNELQQSLPKEELKLYDNEASQSQVTDAKPVQEEKMKESPLKAEKQENPQKRKVKKLIPDKLIPKQEEPNEENMNTEKSDSKQEGLSKKEQAKRDKELKQQEKELKMQQEKDEKLKKELEKKNKKESISKQEKTDESQQDQPKLINSKIMNDAESSKQDSTSLDKKEIAKQEKMLKEKLKKEKEEATKQEKELKQKKDKEQKEQKELEKKAKQQEKEKIKKREVLDLDKNKLFELSEVSKQEKIRRSTDRKSESKDKQQNNEKPVVQNQQLKQYADLDLDLE